MAEAYWHAHSADGRVPWGKFAGYETEWQFYRCASARACSALDRMIEAGG